MHPWFNFFMRITGGHAARRILKVPKGLDVRPTPDKVKQALFNSLAARVEGARVLELFAGSGALSLECLSRGAGRGFVHRRNHIAMRNSSGSNAENSRVRRGFWRRARQDVFPVMKQLAETGQQFDLILADPPGMVKKM